MALVALFCYDRACFFLRSVLHLYSRLVFILGLIVFPIVGFSNSGLAVFFSFEDRDRAVQQLEVVSKTFNIEASITDTEVKNTTYYRVVGPSMTESAARALINKAKDQGYGDTWFLSVATADPRPRQSPTDNRPPFKAAVTKPGVVLT